MTYVYAIGYKLLGSEQTFAFCIVTPNVDHHRLVLQKLQLIQRALIKKFDVRHWLYNIQLTPCVYHRMGCAFAGRDKLGWVLSNFRVGRKTANRLLLERLVAKEQELVNARRALFTSLT